MKKLFITLLLFCFYVAQGAHGAMIIQQFTSAGGASASDDFTGTNTSNLDTEDWTHPKTVEDGTYNFFDYWNNSAQCPANRRCAAYTAKDVFDDDHKSCAKIVGYVSSGNWYWVGPAVRISTTTNAHSFYVLATYNSGWALLKVSGTGETVLDSGTDTISLNDTLCLSVTGSATTNLVGTLNGSQLTNTDDSSSPNTTGQPGIGARSTGSNNPRVDDWTGDDI